MFYDGRGRCKPCRGVGLGLKRIKKLSITEQQQAEAAQLYSTGLSMESMAQKLNSSCGTVGRALKRQGIKKRTASQFQKVLNEKIFENIDTPERAYWLVFWPQTATYTGLEFK